MAILSSDGKSCIVEKGNSLWSICDQFLGGGTWEKCAQLAAINGIQQTTLNGKTSYLIYTGQTIYLYSDSTPSSTNTATSNLAVIDGPHLRADVDDTLFACWTFNRSNTDTYEVQWRYQTTDNMWYTQTITTTDYKVSEYGIPPDAKQVAIRVHPVAKKQTKKKSDGTTYEEAYWTVSWTGWKSYSVGAIAAMTPSAPAVTIDGYKLTSTLDAIDVNADYIQFRILRDDTTVIKTSEKIKVQHPYSGAPGYASYSYTVAAGHEYKVCCKAFRNGLQSEWSAYSSVVGTPPSASKGIFGIKAMSDTEVYVDWYDVSNATGYDLEYTTEKRYFDSSNQVTSMSIDSSDGHAEVTGLESGQTYFFRVRAKNKNGESAWTEPASIVIGKPPVAPTTWSSTTTAITGEPLTLYWIHNAEDGSNQTYAELALTIGGNTRYYTISEPGEYGINSSGTLYTIKKFTEDEEGKTNSCLVNTSVYTEGTKIQWCVRTAGITKVYGDMSIQRTVDIYAPPTVELDVFKSTNTSINTIESFPFYVSALAGPNTQTPIGYHLSIISDETYETIDNMGNQKIVKAGEAVYSNYFSTSEKLLVTLSANNVDLQNGINYTIKCTVSMNSGLTAEASYNIDVSWLETSYMPNAEIGIDTEAYTALIRPYCEEYILRYYKVEKKYNRYTKTTTEIGRVSGDKLRSTVTTTGEDVYEGVTADGEKVYYCLVEESNALNDVNMSVYRREFDGRFTEIATGLDSSKNAYVTDPHPSLDYARYRIVATSKTTGAVSYYDVPGYPVGGTAIIIQWDEARSNFDTFGVSDELIEPSWSGSLLKLPYNVDVSESNNPDTAFVEYVGRSHPVSYYGTQLGESATWSVVIPKSDKETIYALRRLKVWRGNAYVREPSGVGYWANVTVSFNQKHRDLTVPVTLNITRVEGGM